MFIAQKVASYTMGKADALRKAMGKKKLEVLEAEYKGFKEGGMTANGFSEAAVKALWDTILPFAGYAFNKSHAAGYGLVSFWTAYLKANFQAEYMAGLLTSVGDDKDKAAVYLSDCRRLGITVLPPDVNESVHNFASVGQDIRYGLGGVRNVGGNVVQSIINGRKEKGKYTDFSDYLNKIDITACNKKVTESLIKAGGRSTRSAIRARACSWYMPTPWTRCWAPRRPRPSASSICSAAATPTPASSRCSPSRCPTASGRTNTSSPWNGRCWVSTCPVIRSTGVAHLLSAQVDTQIPAILEGDIANDTQVRIGGILASVNRRVNKNGLPWASAQLEDLTGGIEVLFFPQTYSAFGADIADDAWCWSEPRWPFAMTGSR